MPDQPAYPSPPPFPVPPVGGSPLPPTGTPFYVPSPTIITQPQRGGFARAMFTTLAMSIFGLSLTLNIYLLIASGIFSNHGPRIEKTTLTDGDEKRVVAVVPIEGEINGSTASQFKAAVKEITADANVKALLIRMNTPGGEVAASDEIYEDIQRLKRENHLPVVVSIGALGTSGGYYISCAADKIVAERTTWTGNIGVLLPRINLAKFGEKYGIEDMTIKSSGADYKDAGSMFKHDTPEQTAYWQALADEAFGVFKGVVRDGRKLDAATVDRIANGKVYSGDEAAKLKLVDQVGYSEDAVALAESLAGLRGTSAKVVRYEQSHGLLESLGGSSRLSSSQQSVKTQVGPAEVSIDASAVRQWLTPRPLYLWSGF